jgi:hypothetical protein
MLTAKAKLLMLFVHLICSNKQIPQVLPFATDITPAIKIPKKRYQRFV